MKFKGKVHSTPSLLSATQQRVGTQEKVKSKHSKFEKYGHNLFSNTTPRKCPVVEHLPIGELAQSESQYLVTWVLFPLSSYNNPCPRAFLMYLRM